MKKVILAVALATFAGAAFAQEHPDPAMYDRYEYNHEDNEVDVDGVQGSLNSNSGNSNSNNLSVSGGQTTYNGSVTRVNSARNTPSMAAPMATSGYDTCVVGMSGSASGPGFGVSFGKGKTDNNCERIKLAKAMQSIGLNDAAVAILAQDKRVADAIRLAYPALAKKVIKEDADAAAEVAALEAKQQELWEHQRTYEEDYWNNINYLRKTN